MKKLEIVRRYVKALYSASLPCIDPAILQAELNGIIKAIASNEKFRIFLLHPSAPKRDKISLFAEVFSSRISQCTMNFCHLLIEKSRIDYLQEIANELSHMIDNLRCIKHVDLRTAYPLSPALIEAASNKFSSLLNRKVQMHVHIDPSVIGGVKAHIDGNVIDGSIASELVQLKQKLVKDYSVKEVA